ncbi:Crp/Fnr family transcriptional regulator [Paenibacillus mesophilus]|uniref:Crp/Fnr family transcriptional regulator n=1 Tax=Paenibacillus mesophilus TaxID=2582849 RepID=UPI003B75BFCA
MEPVKKGTIVTSPHKTKQTLYLVKSGAVRLYSMTAEGRELTLDVLAAGHLFGEIGSLVSESSMYAVTLEDSIICTIDYEQFKSLLREKPELSIKFIEIMSARIKEVEELLEHMAYSSVRIRLLYLLHKLANKFGENSIGKESEAVQHDWIKLGVELTHQELASMTGCIRETVTETLNRLAAEGILIKSGVRQPLWVHIDRLKDELARH